jgi:uncharacterized protein
MKQSIFIAFLLLSACSPSEPPPVKDTGIRLPEPGAYVDDFEGSITSDMTGESVNYTRLELLDSTVTEFERRTGNEIAIVSVADYAPYKSMKDYAVAIGKQWGVGKKKKNNGLVIAVSAHKREVFIATGLGTEKIITDSICDYELATKMLPRFREGKIYEGIRDGLNDIISVWTKLDPTNSQSSQ